MKHMVYWREVLELTNVLLSESEVQLDLQENCMSLIREKRFLQHQGGENENMNMA